MNKKTIALILNCALRGAIVLIAGNYLSDVFKTGKLDPYNYVLVCKDAEAVKTIQPVNLAFSTGYFVIGTSGGTMELHDTVRIGEIVCFETVWQRKNEK
jgi:hypothetical protein